LDELLPAVSQTGPFANNDYIGFGDNEIGRKLQMLGPNDLEDQRRKL